MHTYGRAHSRTHTHLYTGPWSGLPWGQGGHDSRPLQSQPMNIDHLAILNHWGPETLSGPQGLRAPRLGQTSSMWTCRQSFHQYSTSTFCECMHGLQEHLYRQLMGSCAINMWCYSTADSNCIFIFIGNCCSSGRKQQSWEQWRETQPTALCLLSLSRADGDGSHEKCSVSVFSLQHSSY